MPKAAMRQADQSVNGLFAALGVDAGSLPRTRPLYRRIVALVEDGIARGRMAAGFQLPPERDLAAALAISRATVVSAYRELEARGLVRCLIDRGDAVVVDRPGYLGAIQTFRNAGARLVGWDVAAADLDELEELLLRYRPKLIYTNPTNQNPTGSTMPVRTRRELLELGARYRVPT